VLTTSLVLTLRSWRDARRQPAEAANGRRVLEPTTGRGPLGARA
jgi:hypothetical protein